MNMTILVPVDYSDVTDALLAEARRLAKALHAGIHLVHAVTIDRPVYTTFQAEIGVGYPRQDEAEQLQEATARLAALAETHRSDLRGVTTTLLEGNPGAGIMEEARRVKPMMIVLGSHGHGALHHLLAGSVCEYVMKHATCPIMVVPSRIANYQPDRDQAHAVTTA